MQLTVLEDEKKRFARLTDSLTDEGVDIGRADTLLVGKEIERDREKGTHLKSCGRQPRAIKKKGEEKKYILCEEEEEKIPRIFV